MDEIERHREILARYYDPNADAHRTAAQAFFVPGCGDCKTPAGKMSSTFPLKNVLNFVRTFTTATNTAAAAAAEGHREPVTAAAAEGQ